MSRIDSSTSTRIAFLDNIRYLMIVLVVVYHSAAAYSTVAPWWGVHDGSFSIADIIRELFDVFMMPVVFFISGYFALPSLEKQGVKEFIKDKGKRLLIPWAFGVFVVTPLIFYDRPDQLVKPFWNYWLNWIGSFKTGLSSLPPFMPQTNQGVYWFVSLLFAFYVLFAVFHTVTRQWRSRTVSNMPRKVISGNSMLVTLMLFGVMTSVVYFFSLLFIPDMSWFTLSAFLQFEPTHLVLSVSYFALGVYAKSRGWFADQKPLGSPARWVAISVVLAILFLVTVQPLYANLSGTANLSVQLLAALAFVRSFLLLSMLVMLVSVGVRYWNHSTSFDRQLSQTSFGIYLSHIWFVVIVQTGLMEWTGGPALAKFAIVLPVSLALSFAVNRWLGRYHRAFGVILLLLFVFCLVFRP